MWARWAGSMPLSGSSMSTTSGSCTSAPATLIRCRIPLRVAADPAVGRGGHLDGRERAVGRLVGVFIFCRVALRRTNSRPVRERIDGLRFVHEAEATVQVDMRPSRVAVDPDRPVRGAEQTGHHLEDGRLARAVGPEQGGDARRDAEGDVGDGDDVAVPLGDALDENRRLRSPRRRRVGGRVAGAAPAAEGGDRAVSSQSSGT